jgi:hypothetical protein
MARKLHVATKQANFRRPAPALCPDALRASDILNWNAVHGEPSAEYLEERCPDPEICLGIEKAMHAVPLTS